MLGIRFADLPKTFQDAIMVARYLGVRYLWIDALCIVQDDKIDWHREALSMGNIYQNAICTIAVHDALDDSQGFLADSLRPPASVSLGSNHNSADSTVSLRSNFRAAVEKSELSRRGWVLQERFLSTRTLHFTKTSVFFEDGRGVTSEEDAPATTSSSARLLSAPVDNHSMTTFSAATYSDPVADTPRTAIPFAIGHGGSWNQTDGANEFQLSKAWPMTWLPKKVEVRPFNAHARSWDIMEYTNSWFELLERYSTTQLTFESDKFPAISGLIKSFQKHTDECFISGIWVTTFHIGLLWAALRSPLRRPKVRRAASWSWASRDGPIQHPVSIEYNKIEPKAELQVDASFERGNLVQTICPLTLYAKMRLLSRLESITCDEIPLFFRRSTHVYRMFGVKKFKPLIWFSPEKIKEEQQRCRPSVGPIGFAVLDDLPTSQEPQEIRCVEIAENLLGGSETETKVWVLLVSPNPFSFGHWHRVGMGSIELESNQEPWFDDITTVKVTLV
jgi:hypothetical protein